MGIVISDHLQLFFGYLRINQTSVCIILHAAHSNEILSSLNSSNSLEPAANRMLDDSWLAAIVRVLCAWIATTVYHLRLCTLCLPSKTFGKTSLGRFLRSEYSTVVCVRRRARRQRNIMMQQTCHEHQNSIACLLGVFSDAHGGDCMPDHALPWALLGLKPADFATECLAVRRGLCVAACCISVETVRCIFDSGAYVSAL